MKADITRDTFDRKKQFTRVLMQQGRVQLDADWNEQAAILLHYLQTLAADLIGPHGGLGDGYKISPVLDNGKIVDLGIEYGRYYVDGILCENLEYGDENGKRIPITYYQQGHYPLNKAKELLPAFPFLVYLDVWERLITSVEDDNIREVALGGADTAVRTQVVWQVKTNAVTDQVADDLLDANKFDKTWQALVRDWQPENRGLLKARAKVSTAGQDDACITPPDARYRGTENQLYRVEIHDGGTEGRATGKWSRDNGSVVFPIRRLSGNVAVVEGLAGNGRFTLQPGDWVEVVDDESVLRGEVRSLQKVKAVDRDTMTVTLAGDSSPTYDKKSQTHPLLRRWDGFADIIKEGKDGDNWLSLEDGLQVQFQPLNHTYRSGDYWLIPARTATGDVEWPGSVDQPESGKPHGMLHHYAPLALVIADGNVTGLRRQLIPLGVPVS